jgi:uncharacterized integral membrane protein
MRYLQISLLVLFLLALLIFSVQNRAAVPIHFLNWSADVPLALLALLVYVLGMLSGWTVLGFVRRSLRSVSSHPHNQA